ncbi:MAG: hypothetical protein JNL08_11025 [Planctomycetes bacterium]|nr:hypothetical protein [Planctomycetota bacterium]
MCLSVAVALLFGACAGVGRLPPPPRGQDLAPWQAALRDLGPLVAATLPDDPAAFEFGDAATVVVLHDGAPDAGGWTVAQRQGLGRFVERGGRLLLLGQAATLAAALAIEPEWPEPVTFRWGFDRRATLGRAWLGLEVVTGAVPELFAPLVAAAGREHTYYLCGGEPCAVPLCTWRVGAPQRGEVLARLAVERDGAAEPAGPPVLVRWRRGHGEVLALGLVPDTGHGDPTVRGNAVAFLRAAVKMLRPQPDARLVLLTVPPPAAAAPLAVPAAFTPRHGPNLPLLAHWGWRAPLLDADTAALRRADELTRDVLLPSWLAGADLLELELGDDAQRPPLAWPSRDPLKRPAAWPSAEDRLVWPAGEPRRLAAEAHARGLLLFAAVPSLAGDARQAERLAALRFLARELACVRRLSDGAFDGFGLTEDADATLGLAGAMLQDFQPAAALYGTGERSGSPLGGFRALDADDGAVPGLGLAGISAHWRAGFAALAFPLGVLDARARRGAVAADAVAGGGSHGDWIVTQANDFVRDRAGLGGAMWWRRFDPQSFDADSLAYVHGTSLEPLLAAVAMRLSATGSDGHRAAARALLDTAPAGFGAESDAPAAVHVLQNNWFRLTGSGGALAYDPDGRARFGTGAPRLLAASFLRTRLYGARPDLDEAAVASVDLLANGLAPAGGHAASVRAVVAADERLPALLAFARAPEWPAAVGAEWHGTAGYHELEYRLRGEAARGIVAIALDGALLCCVPVRAGEVAAGIVPLHLVRSGPHTLQFEQLEGGAVAFERLRIVRRGDVGAAANVLEPAGCLARLEERSTSSLHADRLEFTAIADLPGFVLRVQWDAAARGLQVERRFQFAGHRVPAGADLRQPFVLAAIDRALPDVVVVPLQLGRHDTLAVDSGALVLHAAPQVGHQQRLGFLFVPHARSRAVAADAVALCRAIDQPTSLDVLATGEALLHAGLALPWTRVVRLDGGITTPVAVRENGWWTWRGTQATADGARLLRVRHEPGDVVQLCVGPAVLARTRPGPGSAHVLALRDPEPLSVTVQLAQPSRLVPPSVVMGDDFDAVTLDGEPWAWFDGRTVFLPDRPGTYRIECRRHGGGAEPGVRRTRAPLAACRYDAARGVLVLVAPPLPDRPIELPWTAVLRGPRPRHIVNGEIVAEAELPHADAEAAAAAAAGGTVIRFRSGTTEVFFGGAPEGPK